MSFPAIVLPLFSVLRRNSQSRESGRRPGTAKRRRTDRNRRGTAYACSNRLMTARWRYSRPAVFASSLLAAAWIFFASPCCAEAAAPGHVHPHGVGMTRPADQHADQGAGAQAEVLPGSGERTGHCHHDNHADPGGRSCCDSIGACCTKPLGEKRFVVSSPPQSVGLAPTSFHVDTQQPVVRAFVPATPRLHTTRIFLLNASLLL